MPSLALNNGKGKAAQMPNAMVLVLEAKDLVCSPYPEFTALINTLRLRPQATIRLSVKHPHARYLIGRGQLEQIKEEVRQSNIDLILINTDLSGGHQRNLQSELRVDLLDRSSVILAIFARHARSYQSKLQVELAQLHYQSTHLVRGWSHLERQRGAIGQRGGPGEKQLETDRRLIRKRMGQLNAKLVKIKKQRHLGRRTRQNGSRPLLALVGYTNAGKSSLFNAMTQADALASPRLFATLDPTIRKMRADMGHFLVTDTVGFIDHLSPMLMESFATTLDEIKAAALILHVIDSADQAMEIKRASVGAMLDNLGMRDIPRLNVYNKSDMLEEHPISPVMYDRFGMPMSVRVSATTGAGVFALAHAARQRCMQQPTSTPPIRAHSFLPAWPKIDTLQRT